MSKSSQYGTAPADSSWLDDAACKGKDRALFFPELGQTAAGAKAICTSCPVQEQCLEAALDFPERFGIWGGKSEKERLALRRKRQQGKRKTSKSLIAARDDLCPNNHRFTPENTLLTPKGYRRCRQCARDRQRAYKAAAGRDD